MLLKRKNNASWRLLAVIVILLMLSLRLAAWLSAEYSNKQVTLSRFNVTSSQEAEQFKTLIEFYADTLYSGRAFSLVDGNWQNQSSWSTFMASQQIFHRYPGISSVDYVSLRSQSGNNSSISVILQYPSVIKSPSLGNLFAKNSNSLPFLRTAASSGQITSMVLPAAEPNSQSVLLLAMPAYNSDSKLTSSTLRQKAAIGFYMSEVSLNSLLISTFHNSDNPYPLNVRITDGNRTVFSDGPRIPANNLIRTVTTTVGNEQWLIRFRAPANYRLSTVEDTTPWLILVSIIPYFILIMTVFFVVFKYYLPIKDQLDLNHKNNKKTYKN